MDSSKTDIIAFLLITIIPLLCILFQIFLSFKERVILSFLIPFLWTALGVWMITAIYRMGDGFSVELVIFFLGGDVILAAASAAVKFFLKSKNKQKGKS